MVFDHLVLHHAHARFGGRQPGQLNPGVVGRKGRAPEDFVHLFLAVLGIGPLGQRRRSNHRFQFIIRCCCLHVCPFRATGAVGAPYRSKYIVINVTIYSYRISVNRFFGVRTGLG